MTPNDLDDPAMDAEQAAHARPSWDQTWLSVAYAIAERGTCPRMRVGAVVVSDDNRILSTGYNGAPHGMPHCDDVGCAIVGGHCVRAIHAEANAIIKLREPAGGGTLYCTHYPCRYCANLIAQSNIRRIVYVMPYGGDEDYLASVAMYNQLGIELRPFGG